MIKLLPWLVILLVGCAPLSYPPGAMRQQAYISENLFITRDGAGLPLKQWLPKIAPKAVLIALHGFNDYSNFFERPGKFFSAQGLACFAYDQRGFGTAPKRGKWAGINAYTNDLLTLTDVLRQRYPTQPIYLIGESMGGAVAIVALAQQAIQPKVNGLILVAPALWARQTMPWYQTSLLWALAHTMPWLTLTGEGVKVQASDNIEMLKALGRDPQIIKKTKVESVYGLTDLMDAAFSSADLLSTKTLVLYGEKDEIIPKKPTYDFLQRFLKSPGEAKSVAIYPKGYHMLLRDLNASVVWKDILHWINEAAPLPSGAENRAAEVLKLL